MEVGYTEYLTGGLRVELVKEDKTIRLYSDDHSAFAVSLTLDGYMTVLLKNFLDSMDEQPTREQIRDDQIERGL